MRINIDIDEATLEEVMKFTGETEKGTAVVKAATHFLRQKRVSDYARKVMDGEFEDYPLTNDELESSDR